MTRTLDMVDLPGVFPQKKSQTRTKHRFLEEYLGAWGGIIVNSAKSARRLCYVDTCSGSGLYLRDPDEREPTKKYSFGSALIGARALSSLVRYAAGRGVPCAAKAIFINSSARELKTLRRAVERYVPDAPDCEYWEGPLETFQTKLETACTGWFAFVLVDPYGPAATPFSAVARLVRLPHADVLINFPFLTYQRWSGFVDKADMTPDQILMLSRADANMGGPEWREIARHAKGAEFERRLRDHYMTKLHAQGVGVVCVPLLFESKDRVIYHLLFTSHKVSALAAAKEKFQKAEQYQAFLREEAAVRRSQQMEFDFGTTPEAVRVDVDDLASVLRQWFAGKVVSVEEVIGRAIQEPGVLQSDVKKALRRLAGSKPPRAAITSLKYEGRVTFFPAA